MIRVLIADDHPLLRTGLRHVLSQDPDLTVAGEAENAGQVLRSVEEQPYDIVVLTGSVPVLPRALLESLSPGGRVFAVIGEAPVMTAKILTCTAPGAFRTAELFETLLAPLANCERPSRFIF